LDPLKYGENECEAGRLNILVCGPRVFYEVIARHNINIAVVNNVDCYWLGFTLAKITNYKKYL